MHNSAVAVNVAIQVWGGMPGCLPYKPGGKDEVIKKVKKVRTILVESQANYMILRHHFAGVVSEERRVPRVRAIGSHRGRGSYQIKSRLVPCGSADEGGRRLVFTALESPCHQQGVDNIFIIFYVTFFYLI